jgi:hypothetical protein
MGEANDTATIPLSVYLGLLESEKKLTALEAAGVDNWEGYGNAMAVLRGEAEEDY